jgi:hypothetical protein
MINEKQLAMAESTTTARTAGWPKSAGSYGACNFGIDALIRVPQHTRARTSRTAASKHA